MEHEREKPKACLVCCTSDISLSLSLMLSAEVLLLFTFFDRPTDLRVPCRVVLETLDVHAGTMRVKSYF